MKRISILMVLICLLSSYKEETLKLLFYNQDNSLDSGLMLTEEVGTMKDLLIESGFEVVIATISGEELKSDQINESRQNNSKIP